MLSLLRIVSGLIFLEHGTQKFLGFPPGQAAGSGLALDDPGAWAGLFEIGCGLLIALGLFTRPAAFLASGVMAVAYWMAHFPRGLFPGQQYGRRGDPLLLRLPLSRRRRAGAVEPRCVANRRGFAETLDFRGISCYMIAIEADALRIRTGDQRKNCRTSDSRTASFGADAGFDPALRRPFSKEGFD